MANDRTIVIRLRPHRRRRIVRRIVQGVVLVIVVSALSVNVDALTGPGEFPHKRNRVEIGTAAVTTTIPVCQEDEVITFEMNDGMTNLKCENFDDLVIDYLIDRAEWDQGLEILIQEAAEIALDR